MNAAHIETVVPGPLTTIQDMGRSGWRHIGVARAGALDPDAADLVRRQLEKGQIGGLGLTVDDCRKTYQELSAKGVTFLQEPADRPYGVEAVMRDNSGNWLVLVEPKDYTPADFT